MVMQYLLLLMLLAGAEARPFRGDNLWEIILCHPSDSAPPSSITNTYNVTYYQRMIHSNSYNGNAQRMWKGVSYGSFFISGSVHGWYRMGLTLAQCQAKAGGLGDRWALVNACKNAAQAGTGATAFTIPAGANVAYYTYPSMDLFGATGTAFFPYNAEVGAFSHEAGHGLGLQHSYTSDLRYQNADWSGKGEYGDVFDFMSYANVYATDSPGPSQWGSWGPGLNAYHLDRMGWMPRNKIYRFGADGVYSKTITLDSLTRPTGSNYLMVRIPINKDDKFNYLTVEYRTNEAGKLDSGLPSSRILIHLVQKAYGSTNNYLGYRSFILVNTSKSSVDLSATLDTIKRVNYTSIKVVEQTVTTAKVAISTILHKRCKVGYVWREATTSDFTCVIVAQRTQAKNDNLASPSRTNKDGTCKTGFVYRLATKGDTVCVTPATRTQVAADNTAAASRIDPAFANVFGQVYGPNTCKSGYVWREADMSDWVCVSGTTRDQVKADNAAAESRWTSGAYGSKTCVSGYVWREAFPGDKVCVTPARRLAAKNDNKEAQNRLQDPSA